MLSPIYNAQGNCPGSSGDLGLVGKSSRLLDSPDACLPSRCAAVWSAYGERGTRRVRLPVAALAVLAMVLIAVWSEWRRGGTGVVSFLLALGLSLATGSNPFATPWGRHNVRPHRTATKRLVGSLRAPRCRPDGEPGRTLQSSSAEALVPRVDEQAAGVEHHGAGASHG